MVEINQTTKPLDRVATGKFKYSAKTNTGYSINMTGNIFGPQHASVVVAALDSQLTDDINVLLSAHALLEALKEGLQTLQTASRQLSEDHKMVLSGRGWGWRTIAKIEGVIAKAEGQS